MCGPVPSSGCGQPDCASCNLNEPEWGRIVPPPELLHVVAECWPFSADRQGIWLLCREEPLRTEPLTRGATGFDEIKRELRRHRMLADELVLHQTSSRPEWVAGIWTFVAVIDCDGPVLSRWPDALPMSIKAAEHVGPPPTHAAADAPDWSYWHVVEHCLRHLAFLLSPWGDAETASKLDENWRRHLGVWTPTLYRMYQPESA